MIKTIITKKRVDFREAYESLSDKNGFKHALMASQKWATKRSFYDAMDGKIWLTEKETDDILYLLNKHR